MILSTEIYKLRYTTRTLVPRAQCYNLSLILLRPRNPYNKSEDSIEAADQSQASIEAGPITGQYSPVSPGDC